MAACELCKSNKIDDVQYGEMLRKGKLYVHTYCLYLSSNLCQNGDDDNGLFGFLPKDIRKEADRIADLKCCFCGKYYANIGCCERRCRRTFHLICGIENDAENQFVKTYKSFCNRHVRKVGSRPRSRNEQCCICYDKLYANGESFCAVRMLLAPCCHNGWFHKLCLQTFAKTAGYFFKCPLCNDKEVFCTQLSYHGIFIPKRDAAWELEPNAFAELLERPNSCSATDCWNSDGRTSNNSRNPLMLCSTCGSSAMHKQCLPNNSMRNQYYCHDCSIGAVDSGRESLHVSEEPAETLDVEIDVCNDSNDSGRMKDLTEQHTKCGSKSKSVNRYVLNDSCDDNDNYDDEQPKIRVRRSNIIILHDTNEVEDDDEDNDNLVLSELQTRKKQQSPSSKHATEVSNTSKATEKINDLPANSDDDNVQPRAHTKRSKCLVLNDDDDEDENEAVQKPKINNINPVETAVTESSEDDSCIRIAKRNKSAVILDEEDGDGVDPKDDFRVIAKNDIDYINCDKGSNDAATAAATITIIDGVTKNRNKIDSSASSDDDNEQPRMHTNRVKCLMLHDEDDDDDEALDNLNPVETVTSQSSQDESCLRIAKRNKCAVILDDEEPDIDNINDVETIKKSNLVSEDATESSEDDSFIKNVKCAKSTPILNDEDAKMADVVYGVVTKEVSITMEHVKFTYGAAADTEKCSAHIDLNNMDDQGKGRIAEGDTDIQIVADSKDCEKQVRDAAYDDIIEINDSIEEQNIDDVNNIDEHRISIEELETTLDNASVYSDSSSDVTFGPNKPLGGYNIKTRSQINTNNNNNSFGLNVSLISFLNETVAHNSPLHANDNNAVTRITRRKSMALNVEIEKETKGEQQQRSRENTRKQKIKRRAVQQPEQLKTQKSNCDTKRTTYASTMHCNSPFIESEHEAALYSGIHINQRRRKCVNAATAVATSQNNSANSSAYTSADSSETSCNTYNTASSSLSRYRSLSGNSSTSESSSTSNKRVKVLVKRMHCVSSSSSSCSSKDVVALKRQKLAATNSNSSSSSSSSTTTTDDDDENLTPPATAATQAQQHQPQRNLLQRIMHRENLRNPMRRKFTNITPYIAPKFQRVDGKLKKAPTSNIRNETLYKPQSGFSRSYNLLVSAQDNK